MEDMLIWVDEQDREIGTGPKMLTHREARLHRAFSVFVYDPVTRDMLLQKRARGKYHSGGLWSNACCSHPRAGEDLETAVHRRLCLELGSDLTGSLLHCGTFVYRADFDGLSEHELDHVFLLSVARETVPLDRFDHTEIEELQWIGMEALDAWLADAPEDFSAWFSRAYTLARSRGIDCIQ